MKLPFFDKFQSLKEKIDSITKEEWTIYKQGKLDYKSQQKAIENKEEYVLLYPKSVEFYKSKSKDVQQYFKLRSEYQRLALNNPIQTCGSHMMKKSAVLLFNWILEKNYQNIVKICNSPYDEFVLECPKELGQEVSDKLTECMITGGNYYLVDITCRAESHFNNSWYSAK